MSLSSREDIFLYGCLPFVTNLTNRYLHLANFARFVFVVGVGKTKIKANLSEADLEQGLSLSIHISYSSDHNFRSIVYEL